MNKFNKILQILSFVFILLLITVIVYTIYRVNHDKKYLVSPLLPKYTAIYLNSRLINFSFIAFFGIFPALTLVFLKKYIYSIVILLLIILVAFLIQDYIKLYEVLY